MEPGINPQNKFSVEKSNWVAWLNKFVAVSYSDGFAGIESAVSMLTCLKNGFHFCVIFEDLEKFEAAFMEEPEPVHIKQEPEHEHTKTVKCTKEETYQLCVIFTAVAGAFIVGAISGGVLVYALSSSAGPLED